MRAFLAAARAEGRGRLKIFLGAAPGVGKTFEMLSEGAALVAQGVDVVVGVVETHGRADTAALTEPLAILPRRRQDGDGRVAGEMDLDALLAVATGVRDTHATLADHPLVLDVSPRLPLVATDPRRRA